MNNSYHSVHLKEDQKRAVLWGELTRYLNRFVPDNAAVLELGAGYCYWINAVKARRKVALDIWDELPKYAADDVRPIIGDLRAGLGVLGNEKFNVALASNLLEHFEPDVTARIVSEVFASMSPGGNFIIIQPNFRFAYKSYFDDYTHRSIFTDVSLPNLLRVNGFVVDHVEPRFMPYSLRDGALPVVPALIRAYLASPIKPFAGQMLIVGQKPL